MASLDVELQDLNKYVNRLREDIVYNEMVPAELYRLIEDLRSEVTSLRGQLQAKDDKINILKTKIDERDAREQIAKNKKDILDSIVVQGHQNGSYANGRYSQYGTNLTYAVSAITLPRDKVSIWTVHLQLVTVSNIFIGVVGPLPADSRHSYNYSKVFSWGINQQVFVDGADRSGMDGWSGWINGDIATLTYNPTEAEPILTVHLDRANRDYTMIIPDDEYSLYFALLKAGNNISIW